MKVWTPTLAFTMDDLSVTIIPMFFFIVLPVVLVVVAVLAAIGARRKGNAVHLKSKVTAYLLWLFFGLFGIHKFYLEKIGMGVVYLLTGGIAGLGWFIDLFTLGRQVDEYNARYAGGVGQIQEQEQIQEQNQNVVVNVTAPQPAFVPPPPQQQYAAATNVQATTTEGSGTSESSRKQLTPAKQILRLAKQRPVLTIRDILSKTSVDFDDADSLLKKMVDRGLAKEVASESGETKYDFSRTKQIPEEPSLSPAKQILKLSESKPVLSLGDILRETKLDMDEAESTLKSIVDRGIAVETVDDSGKTKYDFS